VWSLLCLGTGIIYSQKQGIQTPRQAYLIWPGPATVVLDPSIPMSPVMPLFFVFSVQNFVLFIAQNFELWKLLELRDTYTFLIQKWIQLWSEVSAQCNCRCTNTIAQCPMFLISSDDGGGDGWSLVGLLKTLEWWSRSHLHLCCMNCDHCCWTLCCNHFYVLKKLHILWQANRCCADTRLEHGIWTGSGIKEPTRLAWPEAIPSMYQYLPGRY